MFINQFHLERFGNWSDADCTRLSPGFNVFFGPNGVGKSSLARFLRGTIGGFSPSDRDWLDKRDPHRAPGSITISTDAGPRTVCRVPDAREGKLRISNEREMELAADSLSAALGHTSSSQWDLAHWMDFERRGELKHLLEQAAANGIELAASSEISRKIRELESRSQRVQQELAGLPGDDSPLEVLRERRRRLKAELEQAELVRQQHQTSLLQQRTRLVDLIHDCERRIQEVTSQIHSLDARLSDLRGEIESLGAPHAPTHDVEPQWQQLREIEAQLNRWRAVLQELEERRGAAEDERDRHEGHTTGRQEGHRNVLRRMEERLSSLQADVADWGSIPSDPKLSRIREECLSNLNALRDDIYHLCRELSVWESAVAYWDAAHARDRFRSCEGELRLAIDLLVRRRRELLRRLSLQDPDTLAASHDAYCECHEHPRTASAGTPTFGAKPAATGHLANLQQATRGTTRGGTTGGGTTWDSSRLRTNLQDERSMKQRELDELCGRRTDYERQLQALEKGQPANDASLNGKQAEIRRLDDACRSAERRQERISEARRLENELIELRALDTTSDVTRKACGWIQRLTRGDLQTVSVDENLIVVVTGRRGDPRPIEQLGSGESDQVYLSLALAIAGVWSARGTRPPLLLDDVFLHLDAPGIRAAIEVLGDIAEAGSQILVFTRHEHVLSALADRGAALFDLTRTPLVPTSLKAPVSPPVIVPEIAAPRPLPARPAPIVRDEHAEFFLTEADPVADAPSIDRGNAERLHRAGILTIGDLLRPDAAAIVNQLQSAGLPAPPTAAISCWQDEARLVCRVPRLRPYDARILVGCGIRSADELVRVSPAELRKRIERFADTAEGGLLVRAGTETEFSRLWDWLEGRVPQRTGSSPEVRAGERDSRPNRRARLVRPESAEYDLFDGSDDLADEDRPAPRRRVEREGLRATRGSRFHLELHDAVERAPSIGARVAATLESLGVRKVSDLLHADPDRLAAQLGNRRIKAETVRAWQQQAELVQRIPELRGHDAQILVACGVTTPEELAASNIVDLSRRVSQFAQSSDGKRILRGTAAPDEPEIAGWIQASREARLSRAA